MQKALRVFALLIPATIFGQPQLPTFEAASIKLNRSGTGSSSWDTHPGNIILRNQTLKSLIGIAYHVKTDSISGGPKWIESDRFDIVAKAAGAADDEHLLLMLQSLLKERFQLALHHENKTRPTYTLAVSKTGLKLHPVETSSAPDTFASSGRINAHRISIAKFAETLSRLLDGPVVDQTAAQGLYDITLLWDPSDADGISEALRRKAGMELQDKRLAVDTLMIDSAGKPSED